MPFGLVTVIFFNLATTNILLHGSRYTEFQIIAKRNKKAFLSDQCKEIEESNRMGKTEISRKLEIPREHFMQRWAQKSSEMVWT